MKGPRFLRSLIDVHPEERPIAILMLGYFFLVITSFWILKPIKKTLFITHYATTGLDFLGETFTAPQAEQLAKVLNMVVAALAATVFALLARGLRRQQLTYVFTAFFVVAYGVFALWLQSPSGPAVFSFYLFGDLFSTLMVATFFSFLNDSMSSDAAKRLYGVVGFGGVLGGAFGSSAVSVWINAFGVATWLAIAAAIGAIIVVIAWAAGRQVDRRVRPASASPTPRGPIDSGGAVAGAADVGNPALAGARLVFRSRYLLSIVAIVGLYELASTILDFQFTAAVVEFAGGEDERDQYFASVFAITNWLSMIIQLLLTSFVMRRFGLATALLVLPCAIAVSSMGFFAVPALLTGSLLSISDNAFSYSINQSSKEALYVPTSVEEKYQAKAFIDMFVQRVAKALGVGINLVVTGVFVGFAGIPSLSFVVLPIVGLWGFAGLYAGRRFRALEAGPEPSPNRLDA